MSTKTASPEKAQQKALKKEIKAIRKAHPTAPVASVEALAKKRLAERDKKLKEAIDPMLDEGGPKLVKDYRFFKLIELKGSLFISFQQINAPHLWHFLMQPLETILGTSQFESHNKIFSVDQLSEMLPRLRGEIEDEHDCNLEASPFTELFDVLNERSTKLKEAMNKRIERGLIEASDLPMLFPKGSHVVFDVPGDAFGGIMEDIKLQQTWTGPLWVFGIKVMVNRKGMTEDVIRNVKIPSWAGTRPIAEFPAKIAVHGSQILNDLTERGRVFREITNGVHYVRCGGVLTNEKWYDTIRFRADGRVMIDPISYSMLDSNGHTEQVRSWGLRDVPGYGRGEDSLTKNEARIEIADTDLWRCHTHVLGFSFRAKHWGQMRVADLSQIDYREDAFDHLVLDENYKRTIKALVENSGSSFSDVVEGKGGGCIFLLEGEPGQGKTLTAETVAEVLKRPLYPISVGELGTNADTLEERLRTILDVATRWRAVLLLDEADIFLEARDTNNIERNAMVGVFLRLLEYHEGVLFLTTNRCQNLDRAFLSRISVSISFPKADDNKRAAIWTQLLEAAGLGEMRAHIDDLVKFDINGRQIKNTIRLAQTLAKSEDRTVTIDDIVGTIRLNQNFSDRLAQTQAASEVRRIEAATARHPREPRVA